MTNKVYVTDYDYPSLDIETKELQKIGVPLISEQCRTSDEVIARCHDAVGLLNQYTPITEEVLASLPLLQVIARYGVGVDNVDLEAATAHGVCVVNVPDYCIDEVSNQTIALMMDCLRRTTYLNNVVHKGVWDYSVAKPIYRLRGKTLGFVGFGKIAREVARKMTAFGLNMIAYDPYYDAGKMEALLVAPVSFSRLLQEADIITVHTPLTADTYHLLDAAALAAMKPTAVVINTARGAVIDEQALTDALQNNKIAVAGLDVLEHEPITAETPLLSLENVVLTPHFSWYSEEAEQELKHKAVLGICEVLQGRVPTYLVNQDVLPRLSLR